MQAPSTVGGATELESVSRFSDILDDHLMLQGRNRRASVRHHPSCLLS